MHTLPDLNKDIGNLKPLPQVRHENVEVDSVDEDAESEVSVPYSSSVEEHPISYSSDHTQELSHHEIDAHYEKTEPVLQEIVEAADEDDSESAEVEGKENDGNDVNDDDDDNDDDENEDDDDDDVQEAGAEDTPESG